MKRQIKIFIDDRDLKRIDKIADYESNTASSVIRRLIALALDKYDVFKIEVGKPNKKDK